MNAARYSNFVVKSSGLCLLLALASCGGSGGGGTLNPTIDDAEISITWPDRTREDVPAPGSAMSAHVTIEGGALTGANIDVYITRDNNTGLHTGTYPIGEKMTHAPTKFSSVFYSEPDQQGTIVGIANGSIDATGNKAKFKNISLVQTVKSVRVLPPTTVAVSATPTQLIFEAAGDGNSVVPVTLGSARWTLVSGSGSTLSPDGILTTNEAGSLVVRVTVDGIASANTPITVTSGPIDQVTFEDLTADDSTSSTGTAAGGSGLLAGRYTTAAFPFKPHAAYWTNGTRQDVHPQGQYSSEILGLAGTAGVGVYSPDGSKFRAAIFAAGGVVDLDPTGNFSTALATDGSHQVGHKGRKACLWQGTPQSFVDLHPDGWRESYATGVSGESIAGWITNVPLGGTKAVMWTGVDHDLVDLDPPGFSGSSAFAISGTTAGGYFAQNDMQNSKHACIWRGTAASVVDLNPSFAGGSVVLGLSGDVAVGWYVRPNNDQIYRACIWNGSASRFVDLNAALGSNYIRGSQALSVAPEPGGYQVVGYAVAKEGATFGARVIVWHVPSSLLQ